MLHCLNVLVIHVCQGNCRGKACSPVADKPFEFGRHAGPQCIALEETTPSDT